MQINIENWKPIIINNISWNYEVSDLGNIKRNDITSNIKKDKYLTPNDNRVSLWNLNEHKYVPICDLVTNAFLPKPCENATLVYKDKDRNNNCLDNLEWKICGKKDDVLVWKDIIVTIENDAHETNYEVSNTGLVRNKTSQKLITQALKSLGKFRVSILVNGKSKTIYVHDLVAQAFIPNPENYKEVIYKDDDVKNNNVDNLEWKPDLVKIKPLPLITTGVKKEPRVEPTIEELEVWKDIFLKDEELKTYSIPTNYEVSDMGRVRTKEKKYIVKTYSNNLGYKRVNLTVNKKANMEFVHRLVAVAFIPLRENAEDVNHKDFNPSNNKLFNLEWVTKSENMLHSVKNNKNRGFRVPLSISEPPNEEYKVLEDYPHIFINKNGIIYNNNIKREYIYSEKSGYKKVNIDKKQKHVHRLVALAYIPNPENKPCVMHKDGDKLNNNIDNLEWSTNSEIRQNSINNGRCLVKGVTQYSLDGDVIKKFKTLNIAAKETGIDKASISKCCLESKDHQTCDGKYLFRYNDKEHVLPDREKIDNRGTKGGVNQYDLKGNFIKTFHSLNEAASEVGSNASDISKVCLGKRRSCKKFIWKYTNN